MREYFNMDVETRKNLPNDQYISSVRFFHHKELTLNPDPGNAIKQKKLINLWNHHHFTDRMVYVHLNNSHYKDDILIQAHPEPCKDSFMTCRWAEDSIHLADKAVIHNIIITDGISVILIPADDQEIQRDGFSIRLPDKAFILGKRKSRRYICLDVSAELTQNDLRVKGQLMDFSPRAFRVKIVPQIPASTLVIKNDSPILIYLYRNEELVFSGSCRHIKQTLRESGQEIVFAPLTDKISLFSKKKNRNPREQIKPLPQVLFKHPFYRKSIQLDINDISTSGFSVYLSPEEDVLITGMIIPELNISFAGALKLKCKAQVVYRREEKKEKICYGFVILDMDVSNYGKLSHILMNIIDPCTNIAVEVNADQLWDFLFDSGFIYPKKYQMIQQFRRNLKETYEKLYRDNPEIAQQLTYQRNGKIYGHVSMIHSYEKTWMIHHLAASSMGGRRTGLSILKQIVRYFDGIYRLPSVRMDYMMFYFRPENSFPDHFFGGFARHLNNPRACSMDLFSYLNFDMTSTNKPLRAGLTIDPCTASDFSELERFYLDSSGGLLIDILRMDKNEQNGESLSDLYARLGFKRNWKCYALKQDKILKAVLVADQSDQGLSLSDFLNGIKILVTNREGLSWNDLSSAIVQLKYLYPINEVPVMINPSNYLATLGVSSEKQYNLWIMDTNYGLQYGEYMLENTKLKLKFIIRSLIRKYLKK